MTYNGYGNGLYLVKQRSKRKGIIHYGIIDIGNRLRHIDVDGRQPTVIHQTPPHMRIDWLQDTGKWDVCGKIINENDAIERINHAFTNPKYDIFINNCEHFVTYVSTGKKESPQIQAAVVIAGLVALVAFANDQ